MPQAPAVAWYEQARDWAPQQASADMRAGKIFTSIVLVNGSRDGCGQCKVFNLCHSCWSSRDPQPSTLILVLCYAAVARAEYMLQCALRSMAGGNFAAAAARFGRCREQLVSLAEAAAETSWSEDSCCRLGDVCGSQVLPHSFLSASV